MIKILQKTGKDRGLHEWETLNEFQAGSWVWAQNPTEEEITELAERFSLEVGHLKDALDIHEVPRMETEETAHYVFARFPLRENGRVVTTPLLIVVGNDFLLTVCLRALPFFERFANGKIEFSTIQKTKLFIQIFAEIVADYNHFVTEIGRKVRVSVDFDHIDNRDIVQFVLFESVLNDFISSLLPTQAILNNILSGRQLQMLEEDQEPVEDLFLGIGQLVERSKATLKTIVNIREAYSTIVANNLNRVIKLLTALTIVLTIPTMIASFYGMNVALPYSQSPLAFWGVIAGTIGISLAVLAIFARNRWL